MITEKDVAAANPMIKCKKLCNDVLKQNLRKQNGSENFSFGE